MMRFKIDENLPHFVSARLQAAGFEATTVAEESLAGTPDENLALICTRENRILVTLDLDFADVRRLRPGSSPGFVVIRLDNQDRSDFQAATDMLLAALAQNDVGGALWIVEKTRVRVRES